jgi:hypothetical protein
MVVENLANRFFSRRPQKRYGAEAPFWPARSRSLRSCRARNAALQKGPRWVTNGCADNADNMSGTSEVPELADPLCATRKSAEVGQIRHRSKTRRSSIALSLEWKTITIRLCCLPSDEASALAQLCKRVSYDCVRVSSRLPLQSDETPLKIRLVIAEGGSGYGSL